ncbi:hypothetical protein Nepgr_017044 [Nepenthes gracilis]|uniref:non-specific serine/threonine protein kinase n=1 Tax=Nepenthes gracilis TaxID=150966 RepID=A0AAD3SPR2_NEPGR|nr:hypothetical protein Nepgr_017044 [Nepenthes gracilis]
MSKIRLFTMAMPSSPVGRSLSLLIFFLLPYNSVSSDEGFQACKPLNCGSVTITYPFYILGRQPSYCGFPGFQLLCQSNSPILKVFNENYTVRNIFYNNQSIKIINSAFVDFNCNRIFSVHNLISDSDDGKFKVASNYTWKVLYLLYDCEKSLYKGLVNYENFTCLDGGANRTVSAAYGGSDLQKAAAISKCISGAISVPYEAEDGDGIERVLTREIILNWTADNCNVCNESGGRCGYDQNVSLFQCFCPDRVHDVRCHPRVSSKLKDGREVAIKRLYQKNHRQVEQFMNEVEILTRLRHRNLVTLYGCTSRHSRELLLVYEYIPNGTVADHLHGNRAKSGFLTWPIRMRIAIDTASALSFLHASDVIHRDVKTYNILLDNNFCVKVGDFGLSRLFPTNVTHISTAPQGTPGYLDPEYHHCYQLTDKSDVYSFGVVLIELISSLPAVDLNRQQLEINLSDYAMSRIQRRAFSDLVDPQLGFESNFEIKQMIILLAELACQCLQHDKGSRPSMDEVLETLIRIESADYKKLETYEMGKNDVASQNTKTPLSPPDIDDVGLLKNVQRPPSPNSVMSNWGSRSTSSTSS